MVLMVMWSFLVGWVSNRVLWCVLVCLSGGNLMLCGLCFFLVVVVRF